MLLARGVALAATFDGTPGPDTFRYARRRRHQANGRRREVDRRLPLSLRGSENITPTLPIHRAA